MVSRARRWVVPASCLLGLGCLQHSAPVVTQQAVSPGTALPEAVARKDGPKRPPQAQTCVAFGDFRLQSAADPKLTALEREQLRDQGRRAYQQALKIDPGCQAAYRGLGRLYQAAGDYERAVETYNKGLKRLPKAAPLWYESGLCHARHKDWNGALEHLKVAVSLDADNAGYAKTLGFCLGMVGRYEESFASFRKVLSEGQAHYNVARVLHHARHDAASRQHVELALRCNPELEPARKLLAELDARDPLPGTGEVVPAGLEAPAGTSVPRSTPPAGQPGNPQAGSAD
jgi:tetratricopeptide (TPR) repeat protein